MKKYRIRYEEFDSEDNTYVNDLWMEFDADNKLHAVNQLINFFCDNSKTKLSCVNEVVVV